MSFVSISAHRTPVAKADLRAGPGQQQSSLPLAAACTSVLCWGLGPLAIKAITAPTTVIAFWRMWLAVPVMVGLAALRGVRLDGALLRRSALGGVLFAASLVTGWAAIQQTSIANATLIPALQPVLVLVVASRLLGESVSRRDLSLASVSIVGIAVFVLGAGHNGGASLQGDLWAVGNLVVWTMYFLEVKRQRTIGVPTLGYLAGVMLTGAISLTPYVLATRGDLHAVGGWEFALVLFVVLVPGVGGHGLMTWAQRFVDVSVLSLLTLGSPVVSATLAWWLRGEALTGWQFAGGALVLAAIGGIIAGHRPREVLEPIAE